MVRVSIVVMKHHGQKQVGEKSISLAYISITEGLKAITEGSQELKQARILEAGTDAEATESYKKLGLVHHGLLGLLSGEPRTTSPGMESPKMGRALPH